MQSIKKIKIKEKGDMGIKRGCGDRVINDKLYMFN
jgi:hypothetical protein